LILEALKSLGDAVSSDTAEYSPTGCHHVHVVQSAAIRDVAEQFRKAGYICEMITCLDNRAVEGGFRLVYHFSQPAPADRHRVFADLPDGEEAPSIATVFESANWHEREVFDMFGVRFSGHPSLKRILTEEGADYHPLLKDFGVETPETTGGSDA